MANLQEVTMHYSEYKKHYDDCSVKTKPGSYNADTKTIVVYLPTVEQAAAKRQKAANALVKYNEAIASATDEQQIANYTAIRDVLVKLLERPADHPSWRKWANVQLDLIVEEYMYYPNF